MINIFEYTDYRKYLKDYYDEKKKTTTFFSYRYIASKVGFKSPGHFTQIIKGQINLSPSMTMSFAKFLKLKTRESEYFELMVLFNQAKKHDEIWQYFNRMLKFKELKVKVLDLDQYEYYDKWYYLAIRELLSFYDFSGPGDLPKLAKKLKPAISIREAKKAIALLEKLNLIAKNKDGYYKPITASTQTDRDIRSEFLINQALQTIDLAKNAVEKIPKNQRSISGIAFCVSKEMFNEIQEEVRNFRRKIAKLAENDKNPDTVYQFNVQLFPMSQNENNRKYL